VFANMTYIHESISCTRHIPVVSSSCTHMTHKDESTDVHTRVDCVHTHDVHARVDFVHTQHTGGVEFVQPSAQLALKVDLSAAKNNLTSQRHGGFISFSTCLAATQRPLSLRAADF